MSDSPFGKKTTKSPGFAGAGSTLFASQSPGGDHHGDEEHDGDHDGPHFEPIIPLPEKIDVKTGEEDDEIMFSHRAKLYRFVAEDKQWKERGVGDIKLLRSAKTGKMRVLMRREQVLKLCANHQITTDMTLQPNAGSDRSWVWSTLADFSEEEHKPERLAVKFKTEGIAKQFKEKFEECQEILKNQASLELPVQEETANQEVVKEDLFAKFKAEKGSWECDICLVRNSSDKVQCAACASPKPGVELSQVSSNIGKPLFSYGSGALSGSGFSFGFTGATDGAGGVFVPLSSEGFFFGSGGSSSGTGFFFGSAGASEASGQADFVFGTSPRAPFSFGIQQQGGNTPGAQDSHSDKQNPTVEGDTSSGDQTVGFAGSRNSGENALSSLGLQNQMPNSSSSAAVTKGVKELVQSGTKTISADSEEKPVSSGMQETEESSSKPARISEEVNPEEKVALSSDKHPSQDVSGDSGTDESESKVEEDLKRDEHSEPEGDAHSSTVESRESVSDSSDTQTGEVGEPAEEA